MYFRGDIYIHKKPNKFSKLNLRLVTFDFFVGREAFCISEELYFLANGEKAVKSALPFSKLIIGKSKFFQ